MNSHSERNRYRRRALATRSFLNRINLRITTLGRVSVPVAKLFFGRGKQIAHFGGGICRETAANTCEVFLKYWLLKLMPVEPKYA